VTALSGPVRRG